MSKKYTRRMQHLNRHNLSSGITYGLLEDEVRNTFYDDILKEAKGKRVIDVGSGSGLLGFYAIKHGAEHVTFIEQDKGASYHISKVAEKMKIKPSKYRVIHDEFVASRWDEYELGDVDLLVHEIIGNFIWNETMTSAFDVYLPNVKIIPSTYELKYSIVLLTDEGFDYLCKLHNQNAGNRSLFKNIKLDPIFSEYYSNVLNHFDTNVRTKPTTLNHIREPEFLDHLYSQSIECYRHSVNINDEHDFKNRRRFKFKLPKTNKPYLILCEPFVHHGEYTLEFKKTTSFNGYNQPVLVPPNLKCKSFEYVFDIEDCYSRIDNYYI